ncbi:MAG: TIGR01244 family sulfur transferase [Pseudomonadota bacterium]
MTDQSSFARLADDFLIAPQITPEDIATLKAEGVQLIINNRPDGEEPGQPKSADIEAAAKAAGLTYVEIPVGRMGVTSQHLDDFDAAVAQSGKTLGFCRSGMRSTIVRAMAKARGGADIDALIEEAAGAGYDITGQRSILESARDG